VGEVLGHLMFCYFVCCCSARLFQCLLTSLNVSHCPIQVLFQACSLTCNLFLSLFQGLDGFGKGLDSLVVFHRGVSIFMALFGQLTERRFILCNIPIERVYVPAHLFAPCGYLVFEQVVSLVTYCELFAYHLDEVVEFLIVRSKYCLDRLHVRSLVNCGSVVDRELYVLDVDRRGDGGYEVM
jgi:hypothetical protein